MFKLIGRTTKKKARSSEASPVKERTNSQKTAADIYDMSDPNEISTVKGFIGKNIYVARIDQITGESSMPRRKIT